MNIRKLEVKDIERIIFLEETYLGESIGKDMLMEGIVTPHLYFYVVEEQEVIGYIGAYILCGQAEILNFVIDESYQRKGYGQLLMNTVLTECMLNETETITLEVKVTNIKGINFYQKNGFKIVNTRKQYYADGSDAYLMIKEL